MTRYFHSLVYPKGADSEQVAEHNTVVNLNAPVHIHTASPHATITACYAAPNSSNDFPLVSIPRKKTRAQVTQKNVAIVAYTP